jgi:hypothetical protein
VKIIEYQMNRAGEKVANLGRLNRARDGFAQRLHGSVRVNMKSYRRVSFSSLSSMRMFEADKCNGMDISFTGLLEYAEWKVFSDRRLPKPDLW